MSNAMDYRLRENGGISDFLLGIAGIIILIIFIGAVVILFMGGFPTIIAVLKSFYESVLKRL